MIFFYEVMNEACRATNVLLIAAVKHNPVLEMGHLTLVHLRSVKGWYRACLSV